jgi:cytosine/uracil/thiamine/allantoin permease
MCDRKGLIIPAPSILRPDFGGTRFSDHDLNMILSEIARRRRRWRFWHYVRLLVIVGFLVWTFMPLAASHR